jgi:hypothetical protein
MIYVVAGQERISVPRGTPWGPNDVTGGPVDELLMALRNSFDGLKVERLSVAHLADDNNVWFITETTRNIDVQLDSMPDGRPPFLLESDDARTRADDVSEAVEVLSGWLRG